MPQLIQQLTGATADKQQTTPFSVAPITSIGCSFRHIPQGRALRLSVGNNQITTDASCQAILKAIARARSWYERIIAGEVTGLPDIAHREKINYAYVKKIFPLALLSPARIEQIFAGQDSVLSLEALLVDIPTQWSGTQPAHA